MKFLKHITIWDDESVLSQPNFPKSFNPGLSTNHPGLVYRNKNKNNSKNKDTCFTAGAECEGENLITSNVTSNVDGRGNYSFLMNVNGEMKEFCNPVGRLAFYITPLIFRRMIAHPAVSIYLCCVHKKKGGFV